MITEIQKKRLSLEQTIWESQKVLFDISRACKHENTARGRLLYSPAKEKIVQTFEGKDDKWNDGCATVFCQDCDKEFGWYCPVNPKGYCEYANHSEDCKFCKQPSERK